MKICCQNDQGQTLVEYVLLLALIVVISLILLQAIDPLLKDNLPSLKKGIQNISQHGDVKQQNPLLSGRLRLY